MKRRTIAIFLLLLLGLPLGLWAQNDVVSAPIQTVQPYNPLLPLQQMYCDTRGNTLGTNLEEWQGPSNLRWDDPGRSRTPVTYIDCLGVLHSSSSGGCSTTFTSGCTPSCNTAPSNLVTVPGTTAVQLSWSPVTGAVNYTISRATALAGPYAVIGTTASTFYDDAGLTEGVTYYYELQSNCTQGSSPPTAPVAVTTGPPATPSGTVTGLAIPNKPANGVQTGQLRLNWNFYAGSDAPGQAMAYEVEQATALAGPYTIIGVVPESGYGDYYIAPGLTNATPYWFKVATGFLTYGAQALSTNPSDYSWGPFCAAVSGTPQDVTGQFSYFSTAYSDTGTVPTRNPGAVLVNFIPLPSFYTSLVAQTGSGVSSEIVWSGWTNPGFTSITGVDLRVGSDYTVYPANIGPQALIQYSLDGGSTWLNLRSSSAAWTTMGETHGVVANNADLVSLLTSQNLTQLQVRAEIYATNAAAVLNIWQVDVLIIGTGTWIAP